MTNMSVRDKIRVGYYDTKSPYPQNISKICPAKGCGEAFSSKDSYCRACGSNIGKFYKAESIKREKLLKVYREEESENTDLFKKEALKELGLIKHLKADKIYSYAWQEGHSGGLSEVFSVLEDIADIFE